MRLRRSEVLDLFFKIARIVWMESTFRRHESGQTGQSLVSVMVGMAVMGIAMMGFMSMMSSQQKETKALREKLASLELARLITVALANTSSCNAIINPSNATGSMTVDTTQATPPAILFTNLPGVWTGGAVSPLSSSLAIANNGIQLRVTSQTTGNLLINFDSTKLVRPLKNLSFPVTLQSSGATNATTITGCSNGGGGTFKFFQGNGCSSCPHGSYSTYNASLKITSYNCYVMTETGALVKFSNVGAPMCASTQIGNSNWAMWSY